MIEPVAQEVASSTQPEGLALGRPASVSERRRVEELIAGNLLGADECISAPEVALALAVEQGSLSLDDPWLRPEDAQLDETMKDVVRCWLGRPTSAERRHAKQLQRLRFERSLERHRARERPCAQDARSWAVVGSWELTGVNVRYVRSMVAALAAGTSRRVGRPAYRQSRSRRPRVFACRRGTHATRAGPGDSEGEPLPPPPASASLAGKKHP